MHAGSSFSVRFRSALLVALAGAASSLTHAQVQPSAGMLRWPDVSKDSIVFSYANDLWVVPKQGGVASPLASPQGQESFARFSADGQTVAFVGNYDGNRDLYTMPLSGGVPVRVTHHPAGETLADWTPDGSLLFIASGLAGLPRQSQLWTVPSAGGMYTQTPVPYAGFGSISPDGQWLAYTPHSTDNRTWKRYRGGMATDVWLYNLRDNTSLQITDWEGTDTIPMWNPAGDSSVVYYLSDQGPEHRLNIWKYDLRTRQRTQLTSHTVDDVRWPSIGPGGAGEGEVVFQLGSELRLLNLSSGVDTPVRVTIPGDRPTIRPRRVDASRLMNSATPSASGKRVAIEARGDVWTAPGKEGVVRNLTRTDDVFERTPTYSPDGKWIAYWSDATGEYELYVMPSDAREPEAKDDKKDQQASERPRGRTPSEALPREARRLTNLGPGFRYTPSWSPDSKWISYTDKAGALMLTNAETGETKQVDKDPWGEPMGASWSHDSGWIAYAKGDEVATNKAIWLYEVATGTTTRVTAPMFNSEEPVFDRKGDWLYFRSNREISSPIYGDIDSTWIYTLTGRLYAVPLRADVKNPLLPSADEETRKKDEEKKDDEKPSDEKPDDEKPDDEKPSEEKPGDEKPEEDKPEESKPEEGKPEGDAPAATQGEEAKEDDKKDDEDKDDEKKDEKKVITIDLAGFESRAIALPLDPGGIGGLSVADGNRLLFVRSGTPRSGTASSVRVFDIAADEPKEQTVVEGVGGYSLSADGKRILFRKDGRWQFANASSGGGNVTSVPASNMMTTIDPRDEWRQILRETYRLHRDFFYEPTLHGVDWQRVYDQYNRMLADAVTREDVAYIQAEMVSELNIGHAYITSPGDVEGSPSMNVGLLGADYELVTTEQGAAYRVSRIITGAAWDVDARGPLAQPGVDVRVGDYLLAVSGVPVDTSKDPWAAFIGTAGRTITVTFGKNPVIDEQAFDVVVSPIDSEAGLRYRAWVEGNRARVYEASSGRIGYIYVPNTGVDGQNELFRQFQGQFHMDALIIDDRWNGGGQIPTRFIELLNRPRTNYWARRDGRDWPWPVESHQGPKAMLANGLAGSGGDMFPWLFRKNQLGPIIGTRTWGGLVGISGNPGLIDGGGISVPTFGFYEKDGTWGVEGHGVDPDIEVIDDPALMRNGADPQLEKAVEVLLAELQSNAYRAPARPASPNRSGFGLPDADK